MLRCLSVLSCVLAATTVTSSVVSGQARKPTASYVVWLTGAVGAGGARRAELVNGEMHTGSHPELVGALALEASRGAYWGGLRHCAVVLAGAVGNGSTVLYGGLTTRSASVAMRAAAGPRLDHQGLFTLIAFDWRPERRFGVGLEAYSAGGTAGLHGVLVRARLRTDY